MAAVGIAAVAILYYASNEGKEYKQRVGITQRAAMVRELLHINGKMTLADAVDVAMSTQVYNADLWQARLVDARAKTAGSRGHKMFEVITRWNRRTDPDTVGAIAYRYWFDELGPKAAQAARAGLPPPTDVDAGQILNALAAAEPKMLKDWGRLDVKYGEVYRVGRQGGKQTWPVGGGSVPGLATPRAISFQLQQDGKTFLGKGGQTSTQLVQLTSPPRSWTLLPLGESDDPASGHFDDMAEKLFSPGKLKPTYFLQREELERVASSRKVLKR